jgi:hypothetical protein
MDMSAEESGLTELRIDEDLMEKMVKAMQKVRDRMHRAARALEESKIPYEVIGGDSVAAWVARVDDSVVRNTQDVDILLRRCDLEAAKVAFSAPASCTAASRGSTRSSTARAPGTRRGPHYLRRRESSIR